MSKKSDGQPKNGAEVVVRTLEARGVEYVFGVPGAKIDGVFNALLDSSSPYRAMAGFSSLQWGWGQR
ncbi:MAG: thiamine pyrophosphate-binding protein [Methylocella sp.]